MSTPDPGSRRLPVHTSYLPTAAALAAYGVEVDENWRGEDRDPARAAVWAARVAATSAAAVALPLVVASLRVWAAALADLNEHGAGDFEWAYDTATTWSAMGLGLDDYRAWGAAYSVDWLAARVASDAGITPEMVAAFNALTFGQDPLGRMNIIAGRVIGLEAAAVTAGADPNPLDSARLAGAGFEQADVVALRVLGADVDAALGALAGGLDHAAVVAAAGMGLPYSWAAAGL